MDIAKFLDNFETIPKEQQLQDIMRIVIHELNSPVSSLLETLALLEDELNKTCTERDAIAPIQKLISACKDSYLSTLQRFVAAINSNGGTYSDAANEVFSVRKILEQCHDEFKTKLLAKKICFKSSIGKNVPLLVYGDQVYLQQIIRNLLSNAIKYTPVEGSVRFSCEQVNADTYQFTISDTGIGIPVDSLQRIFELGYRIDGSSAPGEGIGLAVVYELVKRLSGRVSAENLEQGTSFIVTVPLRSFLK